MPIIEATVEEHYQGAWTATVVQTEEYEGSFELGGQSWVGKALQQNYDGSRYHLQIVGGAGKLATQVSERQYYGGSSVANIFADIVKACGESSGSTSVSARAPSYQRQACTGGQALDYLAAAYGLVWYVTREGEVRLAKSLFSDEVPGTFQVIARDSLGPIFQVNGLADIRPGWTFEGQTIRHIRWIQNPKKLVAEVSFKDVLIKQEGLEYNKTYSAKVESQNADGSLNVIVNGKFGLSNVKWLGGIPGWIEAKEGDLVSVGFWNTDPRQPYAIGIQLGSPTNKAVDMGQLCFQVVGAGPAANAVGAVYYAEPPELTGGATVWLPIAPAVPPTLTGGPPNPLTTVGTSVKGIIVKRSDR